MEPRPPGSTTEPHPGFLSVEDAFGNVSSTSIHFSHVYILLLSFSLLMIAPLSTFLPSWSQ